jgi:hypothetical protein
MLPPTVEYVGPVLGQPDTPFSWVFKASKAMAGASGTKKNCAKILPSAETILLRSEQGVGLFLLREGEG